MRTSNRFPVEYRHVNSYTKSKLLLSRSDPQSHDINDFSIPTTTSGTLRVHFLTEPTMETHLQAICLRVGSLQLPAISHHQGPHYGLHVSHEPLSCGDEKTFDTDTHSLTVDLSDPAPLE